MSAFWGHWPEDGHRHVLQVSRDHPERARRLCRPSRIEASKDVPADSGRSDLPVCGTCNGRTGRRQAGACPVAVSGWVAGRLPEAQARLPDGAA